MLRKSLFFAVLLLSGTMACTQSLPCVSEMKPLEVGSQMPYTKVKVGKAEGYFLIDFGTTTSTIDTSAFMNVAPRLAANSTNRFEQFDFFGSWGTVMLTIQDHSNIQGLGAIQQAGILGTDFLSRHIYLLDFTRKRILKASANTFCSDQTLLRQGFKAASTAGYYTNDPRKLNNDCTPNIPTVPVKIGKATAVAQIDPGYDDHLYRHSVNINQAFFKAIRETGIELEENPSANFSLSTCVSGVLEEVRAYRLPPKTSFSITGVDGNPIVLYSDVNIFLKEIPVAAKSCGGIGTWTIPAAQLGASFLVDAKKVIFDPFAEKVWFYTKQR